MARVLIMHGWNNRRQEGTWHRFLAGSLRQQGHQVLYPQFPATENPTVQDWQDLLLAELDLLGEAGDGETIAIGHSLGCVNWIHAAVTERIKTPVDRLLFVAPADPNLLGEIEGLQADLSNPQTRVAVHATTNSLTVVGSDGDPWTPNGIQETYGSPLGVEALIIPGAKHFTVDDGWGRWQGVFDWVNDSGADITKR